MPRFGLPFQAEALDYRQVFGRTAPVVLEIGFGMGDTTVEIARRAPDCDFIGVEVHTPGVGALLKQVEAHGVENLRVIEHDARAVVAQMIPPASLAAIHVFFPDPWPKARHHKRRLLDESFVAELASRLVVGGCLHLATDWPDYAEQMQAVVATVPTLAGSVGSGESAESGEAAADRILPAFESTTPPVPWRPGTRPMTKFERRGLRLGHPIADVVRYRQAPGD